MICGTNILEECIDSGGSEEIVKRNSDAEGELASKKVGL